MTILDALLKLSDTQALTGAGALSTNVIDLNAIVPQRDPGVGEPMEVLIAVNVAAAVGGTYTFNVVGSPNPDLSAPTVLASRPVLAAALVAGARFTLPVPQTGTGLRYLGMSYVLGGTTPAVTVTAYLQPHGMASVEPKMHGDAITIS